MNESSIAGSTLAVIVPSCDILRYGKLVKVIESLLHQSHKASEIIVVATGCREVGDRLRSDFGHHEGLQIIVEDQMLNSAQSRNIAVKASSADIVAFTDDDSVPDVKWIEKLVEIYHDGDVIAVGGKVTPVWLSNKPSFLPEELYWLVGATHEKIFKDSVTSVRNTFGPNMSFRKAVLEAVGYFDERLGFRGADNSLSHIGGEEQDLGLRIMHKFGKGSIYNPEAVVYHDVPESKTKFSKLIKRAFYFGVAKRLILKKDPFKNNLDTERSYLQQIFTKFVPGHAAGIFYGPRRFTSFKQLAFLAAVVAVIGVGLIYGYVFSK
jgi:glucosyl-dolichyl phosphate glucuronosyltransferase